MTPRHRQGLIACLALALAAIGGALALAGFRLVETFRRTLGLFSGDRGDAVPASDVAVLLLALAGAALLMGAVALAIAGRRAALALERASLIETHV
jgi:hypothetical protein